MMSPLPPLPPDPLQIAIVGFSQQELAQIRRWALDYGRAVAEACAALCESARNDPVRYPEYNEACDDCADAIRKMATEP